MSFVSSLVAWANVPFTVALGVAVGFSVLQMTGLLGLLAGSGDHDADADGEAEADGAHEADHDVDGDHDADQDADHDADNEDGGERGFGYQLLAGLGVGRAPLSIVWQTFALAFGFAGIAANTLYASYAGALPAVTLAWTVPGAAIFAFVVTRAVSRSVGRILADPRQEATTRKELVGHSGVVISSKVNAEFGEVRLQDKTGHVVRIICRTRDERPIPEGREVVIVDYDRTGDHLYVAPLDEDDESASSKARSSS